MFFDKMFKFSSFGSAWITDNFVSAGLIRTTPRMRHNCVQEKITRHLSTLDYLIRGGGGLE